MSNLSRRLVTGACPLGAFAIGEGAIELDHLQRAVAFVEPSAVFVPSRILRRVIKRDRGLWYLGGRASRRSDYTIDGETLRAVVEPAELGRPADQPWPTMVLLLAQPDPDELATTESGVLLTLAWRQLFRDRVRREAALAFQTPRLGRSDVEESPAGLGKTELAEAKAVFIQDGVLFEDDSEQTLIGEFAAQFLDLTHFAPALLAHSFPAIENPLAVEASLLKHLDVPSLLAATRPPGAGLPKVSISSETSEPEPEELTDDLAGSVGHAGAGVEPGGPAQSRGDLRSVEFSKQAEVVAALGNDVRAAILHTKASRSASAHSQVEERAKARAALKQLTRRLQKALFVRKGESELWAEALAPLLRRAARGFWSPEARLLYDLQKVCVDHEREIYRLDTVGWLLSLGKKPLRHPLPHLREITTSNHMRSASRRLPKVSLSREDRARLDLLLRPAVHHAEEALREQFRPWIDSTLESTWVSPANLAERVAYRKLVEELLDQIVAKGFTTLGDLRDAASRSNLKMADLKGPGEFFQGDRLLNADEALAASLDGVHRRGEIYLRTLQRFSALAFGTRTGRLITLFIALPYGGAYMALMGVQEILELVSKHIHHFHVDLNPRWNTLPLGTIILAAIHVRKFRSDVFAALRGTARVLRATFVTLPLRVLNHPLIRRVLTSRLVIALWRTVGKPLLLAAPAWVLADLAGKSRFDAGAVALFVFWASCFVFNTRAGRRLEDLAFEAVVESWREVAGNLLPGLFRVVMETFERLLEWVEKLIYAVDEWLRFREGQSRFALGSKAVLGLAWGVVAYLVRIYVNVLIEPQVNPIKHFPVVTVSHKAMLPFLKDLTHWVERWLIPIFGDVTSATLAWVNVFLLPGFFGFLVWELRSNWRLYEANRPTLLEPVVVGSHGEPVVRLLRPGFHSGTLPKLFAKLRRAEASRGRDQAVVKRRAALHHVEEFLRRFAERDLVALLRESRTLGDAEVLAGSIRLATNRIRVDLHSKGDDHPPLRIEFVEHGGVLEASVFQTGWIDTVDARAKQTLDDAILGFFAMSGVRVVTRAADGPIDPDGVGVAWTAWVAAWDRELSGDPHEPLIPGFEGVLRREGEPGGANSSPPSPAFDSNRHASTRES